MIKYYLIVGKKKINITKILKKTRLLVGDDKGNISEGKYNLSDLIFDLKINIKDKKADGLSRCFTGANGNVFYFNELLNRCEK